MAIQLKKHPQALPHRSAEDLSAQCARWRRRAHLLMVLVGATAALAGVAGIKEIRAARADAAPTALELDEAAAVKITPPNKVAEVASAKPAPPPKLDAGHKERYLEAIGALCAAHLLQSFLNIGLVADGVESEAYTTKEAKETLQSIENLMDQVDTQLGKLTKTGLDADDRAALEQFKAVAVMLRLQAKFLQDYWKNGEKADAERYHEVRKAAWEGLGKIMQP
jgi:hypothetical protein